MTSAHATEQPAEHAPPRPTLAEIEAAAQAAAAERDAGLLAQQVAATPRDEQPEPERTDWQAVVQGIADRSRPARQKAARERTERQRRIEHLRAERRAQHTLAQLAERFDRYVGAQVDHPDVARWVRAALGGSRDSLILLGNVGTGKTWQAVAAYRAVIAGCRCDGIAVPVPGLLDSLRPGREPLARAEDCERIRLLLLDDLAAERASDWTGEVLYRLIDARWARNLPTIITTNATPADVRERLGDRVASRLGGMGRSVVMTGADRRRHG